MENTGKRNAHTVLVQLQLSEGFKVVMTTIEIDDGETQSRSSQVSTIEGMCVRHLAQAKMNAVNNLTNLTVRKTS